MGDPIAPRSGDGDARFMFTFCSSWLVRVPLGPSRPDCIKLAKRLLAAGGTTGAGICGGGGGGAP